MNFDYYQDLFNEWCSNIPPYDPDKSQGQGIVTCCGSREDIKIATYVLLRLLQYYDIELPVEIWQFDFEEDSWWTSLFESLGATVKSTSKEPQSYNTKQIIGWVLKTKALIESGFEDILFLDADVIPLQNPLWMIDFMKKNDLDVFFPGVRLFQQHAGQKKGFGAIRHITGTLPRYLFETGEIALNKRRAWYAINNARFFDVYADFFYRYIRGDKDSMLMGYLLTDTSWQWGATSRLELLEHGFMYYDENDKELFCHRASEKAKLGLTYFNYYVMNDDIANLCEMYLAELRKKLYESSYYSQREEIQHLGGTCS